MLLGAWFLFLGTVQGVLIAQVIKGSTVTLEEVIAKARTDR
jgi:hypothetical protein